MSKSEIHELDVLISHLQAGHELNRIVVQGLDLTPVEDKLWDARIQDVVFLGCTLSDGLMASLVRRGAVIFPSLPNLPFNAYRPTMYKRTELFQGFDRHNPATYVDTPDARIYKHWLNNGRSETQDFMEAMARRLHDVSISDALLTKANEVDPQHRVAIMGGHSLARTSHHYKVIAEISRVLTRAGKMMFSGGGPGAMEATHLGALLADRDDQALDEALDILAHAPLYSDKYWLSAAFEVLEKFPPGPTTPPCIGIPTWHYGHEPPSAFASHIAKYFSNATREEGLLTLAVGGLIVAPGSAGTIQEVFQDAAQNHYKTTGWVSPMIFLDEHYWTQDKAVYPLLKSLSEGEDYGALVGVADTPTAVLDFLVENPPYPADPHSFDFAEHLTQNNS